MTMAFPERTIGGGGPAGAREGANARILNIGLGVWLFLSAFAWMHNYAQFSNAWICGILVVLLALFALGISGARYLNTILAIWLFISAFSLGMGNAATVWNNALVAIAVFIISLVRGGVPGGIGTPRTPRTA